MIPPFLPEPEVVPATSVRRGNSARTLILWVVLIIIFLTIWQFLQPADTHQAAMPSDGPCLESSSARMWGFGMLLPMVVVMIATVRFLRRFRQNDTFTLVQEPGRLAMAQAHFSEAAEKFRATLPAFAKQPTYRTLATMNVAEALLRAGDFDGALTACAEIERQRTMLLGSGPRTYLAVVTAFLYALRGDLTLAETWTENARARIARNREERMGSAARLCMAEAVVAARKGDPTGAIAILDKSWDELRFVLTADTLRVVEVIRAFAEAQGGLRESNTMAERLVRIEPVRRGEFAFLGAEWPEMKAYLAAHGL